MAFPGLSRFAVMQHLRVLERAGLVVSHYEGRVRVNQLNVVPIRRVYERWVTKYEGHWAGALIALKEQLEEGFGAETRGSQRKKDAGRPKGIERRGRGSKAES